MGRALEQQLTSSCLIEQYPAISVDGFKGFLMFSGGQRKVTLETNELRNKGSRVFFLDFLWWSDCYIFSNWCVFFIVIDIFRNETLCLTIYFIPILPTLKNSHPPIKNIQKCPYCNCLQFSETKQFQIIPYVQSIRSICSHRAVKINR